MLLLRPPPSATRTAACCPKHIISGVCRTRTQAAARSAAATDRADYPGVAAPRRPADAAAPRPRRARAATMPARASSPSAAATQKTVLVPIADGTEEMEAVVIVDVLRRAGAQVTVASVEEGGRLAVTCSRGVVLVADAPLSAALAARPAFDLVALPGGMPGAERLGASAELAECLRAQRAAGRPLAAICAAPAVVLEAQGLLPAGQPATAHPAFSAKLAHQASVSERVAVAVGGGGGGGLVLTSRGPGTALELALALVGVLFGEAKAREVAGPMVMAVAGGEWEEAVRKAVAAAQPAAR